MKLVLEYFDNKSHGALAALHLPGRLVLPRRAVTLCASVCPAGPYAWTSPRPSTWQGADPKPTAGESCWACTNRAPRSDVRGQDRKGGRAGSILLCAVDGVLSAQRSHVEA